MNKKRIIISSAIALAITGTAGAVIQHTQSGAEDVPPIVTQVQGHETRITDLENKQASTQEKVEQNSGDIQTLQQAASGATTAPQRAATAQSAPTVESTPTTTPDASNTAPAVVSPDRRTITAVRQTTEGSQRGCWYTLYDPIANSRQGLVLQPLDRACHAVGEVLPVGE